MPLHVTLRMAPHVYNLRSRRSFRVIAAALRIAGDRFNVRVIQFSVQGNHIHLVVEAPNRRALARAIQGFSIRVAKDLLGERASRVLEAFAALAALAVIGAMAWQFTVYAGKIARVGETTWILKIPTAPFWYVGQSGRS